MSFLDRFKRKGQDAEAPDGALTPSPAAPQPTPPAPTAPSRNTDPAANQLAAATVASGYNPDFKLPARRDSPAAPAPASINMTPPAPLPADDAEIELELGDFLHRVPQQLLHPGPHDVHTPLKFNLNDLADRIARGQTTIPLAEIYKRLPLIFRTEVLPSDGAEIRFPWQKVMKLLSDVAGAGSTAGLNSSTAQSLAEKLKSRRAVRNIIPGQPTEARATPPASGRSAAAPPEKTRAALAKTAAPATPPAAAAPAPAQSASAPAPSAPAPVSSADLEAAHSPAGTDDEKLTREEIIRARDAARLQAARVKGEYERQLAALGQERKTISEDRDRVAAQLTQANREIQDKLEQVEFEKSVAAKASENLARLQQEREALQRELQMRDRERESLKKELTKFQQGGEGRVTELISERDELSRQTAELSTRLAELSTAGAVPAAADHSELPKLIDELRQQLVALEDKQLQAAQELQQERAAKASLEVKAAEAERLQQEAVARLEQNQTLLRREFETISRQRETEVARSLKEAQEQVAAAKASHDKLAAELQETRAKLETEAAAAKQHQAAVGASETQAALQQSLQQEFEFKLAEREAAAAKALNETQAEKEALARQLAEIRSQQSADSGWEARAVSQLEADIENYRGRIKTLLQERDALATEKTQLATQHTSVSFEGAAERHRLAARVTELETQLAAAGDLHQRAARTEVEIARISTESQTRLAALQQELVAARKERDEARSASTSEVEKLRHENEQLSRALQTAPTPQAGEQLRSENQRFSQELAAAKIAHEAELVRLREEAQRIAEERDAALGEGEKLMGEIDTLTLAQHTTKESLTVQSGDLEKERNARAGAEQKSEAVLKSLELVTAERQTLADEVMKLGAQLERISAAHDVAHQGNGVEVEARKAAEQALGAAHEQRAGLESRVAQLTTELESNRVEQAKTASASKANQEKLTGKLKAAGEELAKLRAEHETALVNSRVTKKELETRLQTAIDEREHLQKNLTELKAELESSKTHLQAAVAGLGSDREKLTADLEKVTADLTAARATCDALTGASEKERQERSKAEQALAALAKERDAVQEKSTALTKDLDTLRRNQEAALAAMRAELEKSAQERGELQGNLASITGEREQLLGKVTTLTAEITTAKEAHHKLDQERTSLRQKTDALVAELAAAKKTHTETLSATAGDRDQLAAQRATLEKQLSASNTQVQELTLRIKELETTLGGAKTAATRQEETLKLLQEEHQKALAEVAGKHERALAAITTEKDAAIAAIAAEKAAIAATTDDKLSALTSQHEKALSTLSTDKSRQIAALEEKLARQVAEATAEEERNSLAIANAEAKIASLEAQLDLAGREGTALAQQMASSAVAADRELATIKAERDRLVAEKHTLTAEYDEARETHKAQSAVFAREFKAVVKQRDDALFQLEADRQRFEQKSAELAQATAALRKREEELGERFERDLARLRRERDSVIEQRDSLRERIERLIGEQRKMLEDITPQAEHMSSYRHSAEQYTPSEPARETKARETRRKEKEANVIDITSAEVRPAASEPDNGVRIQRVRPVVIPPPQVRSR